MTSPTRIRLHAKHRRRPAVTGLPGFSRSVARTVVVNVTVTVSTSAAGIIIARSLGPSLRGEYAAITAWFGMAFLIGDLGQYTATTFFVARGLPGRPDYVATSRNIMIASGAAVVTLGALAAPLLAPDSPTAVQGFRLAFIACLLSLVGNSYAAALHATNIVQWNLLRLLHPTLFVAAVILLHLTGRLSLTAVMVAFSTTIFAFTALAYLLCRRQRLTGGRATFTLAGPMARYGMGQLAATAPTVVTTRLDQLVLSLTVAAAALGHYAVAVTLTTLAMPIVSALGAVAFPRLASQTLSSTGAARLHRWSVLASVGTGSALMLVLASAAPWLVPTIFGPGFRDAVPIVWLLAPAGVLIPCGQVCADLLRGHGRVLAVAQAQGVAAVAMILLLVTLLPVAGVRGAAMASSGAAAIAFLIMLRALRKLSAESRQSKETRVPAPEHDE